MFRIVVAAGVTVFAAAVVYLTRSPAARLQAVVLQVVG
jgi:hypothetical protein